MASGRLWSLPRAKKRRLILGTGAGWTGDPYSYAGNDPLHAVDPLGLEPITVAQLRGYADNLQGPLTQAAGAVGNWMSENWEYVAGGAMVVAGGVMLATGVGGPVGIALIMVDRDTERLHSAHIAQRAMPRAEVQVLEGAGHGNTLTHPSAMRLVRGFLTNV